VDRFLALLTLSQAKVTLQECDEDQNTPLLLACACGHLDAVKWSVSTP
jgi:ankyrin repeat protein